MLMRRESGDLLEEMYVPACELLGGERCVVCCGNTAVAAFGCHGFFIFNALLDSEDYKK